MLRDSQSGRQPLCRGVELESNGRVARNGVLEENSRRIECGGCHHYDASRPVEAKEAAILFGRWFDRDDPRRTADRHAELVFQVGVDRAFDDLARQARNDGAEEDIRVDDQGNAVERPHPTDRQDVGSFPHSASIGQVRVDRALVQGQHPGADADSVARRGFLQRFDAAQEEGRRVLRRRCPAPMDDLDPPTLHGLDMPLAG